MPETLPWTVTRQEDGSYHCHDGTRLRAIIQRDGARSFRVTRVNSQGKLGGCDTFKTFLEAKAFVTKRPNIWGV